MGFSSTEFASFLASTAAVRFGDFTLKSGKKSKVFFDLGKICEGHDLAMLGDFYADFLIASSLHTVDALFGPAYKGVPIVVATSISLHKKYGFRTPIIFNRKRPKDHAEGGSFVGFDPCLANSVLVLDDVITDGGAKYEAIAMLQQFPHIQIRAFVVAVDREEIDEFGVAYSERFRVNTGLPVLALTTKTEVLRCR
jgi:orotate phosphoribosyltransferase